MIVKFRIISLDGRSERQFFFIPTESDDAANRAWDDEIVKAEIFKRFAR